jgi:hypothetical protein
MKPLILNYAVERSEGSKAIFEYSKKESLNVVLNSKGDIIPFINIHDDAIEFQTKTRTKPEQDDEGSSLLELQTKTKVEAEKDDDSFSMLALQTKTEVNPERDDEVKTLLELQTKTFSKTEQDDN